MKGNLDQTVLKKVFLEFGPDNQKPVAAPYRENTNIHFSKTPQPSDSDVKVLRGFVNCQGIAFVKRNIIHFRASYFYKVATAEAQI